MRWGIAGLFVVLTLAACTSDGSSNEADDDVVPTPEPPAVVVAEEIPPDVPECTGDQVTLHLLDESLSLGAAAAPSSTAEDRNVMLIARDGERCGLSAWPSIRLASITGESDAVVPDPQSSSGPPGGGLLLTGNQRIAGVLRWQSSCAPADAVVTVESVLPSGDVVSADLTGRPGCDPTAENTARTWMIVPDPSPDGPLAVSLEDVPETVPAGGTLRFTVRMYNTGPEPVRLDPCPAYSLGFMEAGDETGPKAGFGQGLDCSGAPDELPPGGQLRFAAELPLGDVPAGFAGGLMATVTLGDGTRAWTVDAGPAVGT